MSDQTIVDAVRAEINGLPERRGDLARVMIRGRRRRASRRAGVASTTLIATAVVVGVLLAMGPQPAPVASDGYLTLIEGFDVPVFDAPAQTEGALVYRGRRGPAPEALEPARLGAEIVIDSRDPSALVVPISEHSPNALRADRLVYLGDLGDTQLALHSFDGHACIYLGNGTRVAGGGICATKDGLAGGDSTDPPVGSWLAWTGLPESASVVVGETSDGSRYWQRVVGRTVVFILPDGNSVDPATLSALDPAGNEVATTRGMDLDLAEIGFPPAADCVGEGPVPADCG